MANLLSSTKRVRHTCYYAYLAMASVFVLPPLLFVTFRQMYGISYTALGSLVLINFCTQLSIDLIFSFFSNKFNLHKTIRIMPLITACGLLIYAIVPSLFPQHAYMGLAVGTVIFSVAAGLGEVLISPTVAALPSDNPTRDMSVLHSLYGYGVLGTIIISTGFLAVFGTENWMYLAVLFALFPIVASILFCRVPLPDFSLSQNKGDRNTKGRKAILGLCLGCIFLGSAAENTMTNWISGFVESALQLPKVAGDLLGMAAFAVLLALTRTVYAKRGKNIFKMLFYSMLGAAICFVLVGVSKNPIISLVFCVMNGICTSMLWPGMLILMEEKLPNPGVAAYALMAAGGDFGASVAPQTLGIVVDKVAASNWAARLSSVISLNTEQIGMKVGMLTAAIFPCLGVLLLIYMGYYFKKRNPVGN